MNEFSFMCPELSGIPLISVIGLGFYSSLNSSSFSVKNCFLVRLVSVLINLEPPDEISTSRQIHKRISVISNPCLLLNYKQYTQSWQFCRWCSILPTHLNFTPRPSVNCMALSVLVSLTPSKSLSTDWKKLKSFENKQSCTSETSCVQYILLFLPLAVRGRTKLVDFLIVIASSLTYLISHAACFSRVQNSWEAAKGIRGLLRHNHNLPKTKAYQWKWLSWAWS